MVVRCGRGEHVILLSCVFLEMEARNNVLACSIAQGGDVVCVSSRLFLVYRSFLTRARRAVMGEWVGWWVKSRERVARRQLGHATSYLSRREKMRRRRELACGDSVGRASYSPRRVWG